MNRILDALSVPFDVTARPSESTAPLKATVPASPDAGSMKPVDATSSCCRSTVAWSGVAAASRASSGPASPWRSNVPPPGVFAVIVNGIFDVSETFVNSTFT